MRQVTDRSGAKIRVEFVLEGLNLLNLFCPSQGVRFFGKKNFQKQTKKI